MQGWGFDTANIKNLIWNNVEKIITRARKDLLKERIRGTVNKIDRLNEKINKSMDNLNKQFPTD